jgi:hypothetical protein
VIRSVLAVLAGYLTMLVGVSTLFALVLALAFGGMPDPTSFEPPLWLMALEIVLAPLFAVAGGYVCAWLAKRHAMRHAFALICLMILLSIVTFFADRGLKPVWSTAAITLLGALGAYAGARLRLSHAALAHQTA